MMNKKTVFLLIVLVLLLTSVALATESDINPPDVIGGFNNPFFIPQNSQPSFIISSAIGFIAGLLTASIGAGGGMIVVPALMSAGLIGIYAVGSELFRLFIMSFIEALRMGVKKRINYSLALYLTIATSLGGYGGYLINKKIFFADPIGSSLFITVLIILWLIFYAFVIIPEFNDEAKKYALKKMQEKEDADLKEDLKKFSKTTDSNTKNNQPDESEKKESQLAQHKIIIEKDEPIFKDEQVWDIAYKMRSIKFPPYIRIKPSIKPIEESSFRNSNLDKNDDVNFETIPLIPLLLLATIGGFFMALTGSGGVVLTYMILTKGFGCVASIIAGSDMARLAISSGIITMGGFGISGFVSIYSITGLIFGTMTGYHIGAKAKNYMEPYRIKGLTSLLVISIIINRVLAIPNQLKLAGATIPESFISVLNSTSNYILIIGMTLFGVWITTSYIIGNYAKYKSYTKLCLSQKEHTQPKQEKK